jgi:hypothetical protein
MKSSYDLCRLDAFSVSNVGDWNEWVLNYLNLLNLLISRNADMMSGKDICFGVVLTVALFNSNQMKQNVFI